DSYPIARLDDNNATSLIISDLEKWGVNTSFLKSGLNGSTPIIVHRILSDSKNNPRHRFEFKNPVSGKWLPGYKPVLSRDVESIYKKLPTSHVFYLDRISRASIDLAKKVKKNGGFVFFEPSSISDIKQFEECLKITDILKFSNDRLKSYKEDYPEIQATLEIETLGSQGLSYRFLDSNWEKLEPFFIKDVVDTAGAGDWCSAGIIGSILEKGNLDLKTIDKNFLKTSLLYGQVLGAINCLYPGARGLMYNLSKDSFESIVSNLLTKNSVSYDAPFDDSLKNENHTHNLEVILSTL